MRKPLQNLWLPLSLLVLVLLPLKADAQNGWVSFGVPSPGGSAIHFVNSNTGIIVGKFVYYRTTNGGSSWSTDSVPYPHNFNDYNAAFFINPNTGWIGMSYQASTLAGGAIYKTTNGGGNWLPAVWTFSGVRAIQFINDNTGYAATGSVPMFHTEGAVYKTTNGGSNWEFVGGAGYTVDVSFINVNTGWAIGFSGDDVSPQINIMIRTTNGGNNWTTLIQDTSTFGNLNPLKKVDFTDANTGYLLRDKLYKSTNGGNSWFLLDTNVLGNNVRSFFFVNKDTGWIGGSFGGKIYRTNDGGASFVSQNIPTASVFGEIQFLDGLTGWAMANNTTLLKTGTGGVTGIHNITTEVPEQYLLYQNYPNPFNPVTKIRFEIPPGVRGERSEVRLSVYDIAGREIAELVKGELQPGVYEYEFDGTGLGSGVYFFKLQSGEFSETRRMVLVK